jgi:hypothetical protein
VQNINQGKVTPYLTLSSYFGTLVELLKVGYAATTVTFCLNSLAMVEVAIAKRNGAQIKHGLEL